LAESVLHELGHRRFVRVDGGLDIGARQDRPKKAMGVFGTTVFAFFIAEMGDKTQVVTIALAAQFRDFLGVVSGTTLGMMLANVPVIYLGSRFADRLSPKVVHIVASVIFVVLGGMALRNALMNTSLLG
jgi:putative Ca2+/H+ antiporter (TMEM165/GDT1 family)